MAWIFSFPFFSLEANTDSAFTQMFGQYRSMSFPNIVRMKIADHYVSRTPTVESNTMTAITANIQALSQSTGRAEKVYQQKIEDMEMEIFKRK